MPTDPVSLKIKVSYGLVGKCFEFPLPQTQHIPRIRGCVFLLLADSSRKRTASLVARRFWFMYMKIWLNIGVYRQIPTNNFVFWSYPRILGKRVGGVGYQLPTGTWADETVCDTDSRWCASLGMLVVKMIEYAFKQMVQVEGIVR